MLSFEKSKNTQDSAAIYGEYCQVYTTSIIDRKIKNALIAHFFRNMH